MTTPAHARAVASHAPHAWRDELVDLIRACSGALIFAVPLLFTMEMWSIGTSADLHKIFIFFLLALLLNVMLNYFAGFRRGTSIRIAVEDAIEALAIGLVLGFVVLLTIDQIQLGDSLQTLSGKVVLEAIPLSIGASVANSVFGRSGERGRSHGGRINDSQPRSGRQELGNDVGATIIGGVFLGFSIAPTDEVSFIASTLDYRHLMGVAALSFVASYGIVFVSDFQRNPTEGPFQGPFSETALCYLVSLGVALSALYLFDRIGGSDPLRMIVAMTVVLGLPATIGGAAGRLLI
jgi:putative integral membrane protein (TIGR02587 family)